MHRLEKHLSSYIFFQCANNMNLRVIMVNVYLKHKNVTKTTTVGMEVMSKDAVMFELNLF